jgi:hypothetical protein
MRLLYGVLLLRYENALPLALYQGTASVVPDP